jgi:peroxiredoxin
MRPLLAFLLLTAPSAFAAGELSNRRAPGFALADSSFKYHDPQDYRGKVLLIEFIQTSCPLCREFTKVLEQAAAKYGSRLQILTIVNPPDTHASVAQFVATYKVTTPILFDCGQAAASYFKATPQNASFHTPHVFLIDPAGIVKNDFGNSVTNQGLFTAPGLFREIDRLLGSQVAQK